LKKSAKTKGWFRSAASGLELAVCILAAFNFVRQEEKINHPTNTPDRELIAGVKMELAGLVTISNGFVSHSRFGMSVIRS
jgi:hypothetical protein